MPTSISYQPQSHRPFAITVICFLGFIGSALTIPMIFSKIAMNFGSWFPAFSGATAAVSLICMIGLWFTRKWAIYAYIVLTGIIQLVLISTGNWMLPVLFAHIAVVFTILISLNDFFKSVANQCLRYLKRQAWAVIVAYMVGIHNFYKQDNKTPEDIVIKIEDIEEQEDNSPKD